MRILHIRPPKIMGALEKSMVQHPINILYLAAEVREAGHHPEVWDFEVEGFSENEIRKRIKNSPPDLVGVSGLTANINIASTILGWIKDEAPEVFTTVGGPHGSALPDRTLREFPDIDAVIMGEGEKTWRELADRLENKKNLAGTLGLAWRDGDNIVVEEKRPLIKDLDELPMPARDLIDHSLYGGAASPGLDATLNKSTEIFTTRGCPEKCIFCAAKVTFGKTIRFRSAQNVLAEIDECIEKYGYRHFTIEDDTFTYRPTRLKKICEGLLKRKISWDCDTRVNTVTREMLHMMAQSGCTKVAFGVESGSPEMLVKLKKGITIEQIKDAFSWAHEAGLITTAFFIIGGHPSETKKDFKMSLDLMKEIDPDLMASAIGVPFPGTEFEELLSKQGLIFSEDWNKYTHIHSIPCWRTEHFSPEELVYMQNKTFRQFFFRPSFIWKTFKKALSVSGMIYYGRSAIQIFQYVFLEKRI